MTLAVFFVLSLFLIAILSLRSRAGEEGVFGGPVLSSSFGASDSLNQLALLTSQAGVLSQPRPADFSQDSYEPGPSAAILADLSQPIGLFNARGGILNYKVQKGDTLSGIALEFGISVQTVINANPEVRARSLKIGQEIKILPASGIVYDVKDGDTPESIAETFGIDLSQIQEFNRSVDFSSLAPGVSLVIPGAVRLSTAYQNGNLSNLGGYFADPALGFNWGQLHPYNAVDIANTCGTKVQAAAEGLVIPDERYGDGISGWNSGYGQFVLIEHPNGTQTRYAHLDKVLVSIGNYVNQGEDIGTMGNTGNVHGPTGCHLHFEVYGAQNPFAR